MQTMAHKPYLVTGIDSILQDYPWDVRIEKEKPATIAQWRAEGTYYIEHKGNKITKQARCLILRRQDNGCHHHDGCNPWIQVLGGPIYDEHRLQVRIAAASSSRFDAIATVLEELKILYGMAFIPNYFEGNDRHWAVGKGYYEERKEREHEVIVCHNTMEPDFLYGVSWENPEDQEDVNMKIKKENCWKP